MKISSYCFLAAAASAHAAVYESRALVQRQSNWTVGQTVETSSGPVSGHAAKNASEVSEYLGIPFAQAPVGNLRFAAPVKYQGNSPINGSSFGFSCPVQTSSQTMIPTPEIIDSANLTAASGAVLQMMSNAKANLSEDCLFLNIWTKPQVGDTKKAVLVWVYGGAFSSGSSSVPGYNGQNIANQEDVIVVSLNYRLNIFGFPGNPNSTNNLGLLDQRMAVEWVRDNIEKFGGDVSRITLFGESAGGASVDWYSYAYKEDPIVAGVIPESGTAFSFGLPAAKPSSATNWFNVTQTLGCGNATSNSEDVLSCMRQQNYTNILNAIPGAAGVSGIISSFSPTVDDKILFSNYTERTPAALPMLIGNNNYEAGLFRLTFALEGIEYPNVFWDAFNLQVFTCPTGVRANVSVALKAPIWRYRYFGVFPNLAISDDAGTWHAAEIPMIFNTSPLEPPATAEQVSIGNYMRGAWAAFAKDPQNGLTAYGWPQYDVTKDTLVRLAYDNITGPNLINPRRYDADCVLVNISSTDTNVALPPQLPDLGASITPTGSGAMPSATGNATGTGSAPVATASSSMGDRLGLSVSVLLGAVAVAWLL